MRATAIGIAAAVIGWIGAGVPSYWGDEAASVMSAQRDWSSLMLELGRIDAVHGLYYAMLHVWIDVFGAGEWSTRAPSAIGAGFLAAGTVVLAARWFGTPTGVLAGLVVAVLPRTTAMATEARSYALAAAAGVWLTVAVVELVRRQPRRRWWVAYGVGLALASVLFLYVLLLVPVHAAVLLGARATRRDWRRWGLGIAVAAVVLAPFAALAFSERRQLRFLAYRNYDTIDRVLISQWFGTPLVAVIGWALVGGGLVATVVALRRPARPRGFGAWGGRVTDAASAAAALPALVTWLVVPTATLVVIDRTFAPTYNPRYLSACVPVVAILAALGIRALVEAAVRAATGGRPSGRADVAAVSVIAWVVAAVVAASVVAPGYLRQRTEFAKDGGSDLRAVADYVAAHAHGGDAVVFDRTTKPSRRPRLAMHLYPAAFVGLEDVALRKPYVERPGIWDLTHPVADVAPTIDASTVWALELPSASAAPDAVPADVASLEQVGYRVVDRHVVHRTVVYRLERG